MRTEIYRKLIHLIFNTVIPLAYLLLGIPRFWMVIILAVCSIAIVAIDLNRRRVKWLAKIFDLFFNGMMRSHEYDGKLTGASYVLIGSFFTVLFFPREIAVLALLFMAFGDTFAALVGMKFGKIKIWNKTLEGTLAGLIVCILVSLYSANIPILVRVIGAVAAMFIEVLPINIDDNLRIPIFAGAVMYLLQIVL